MMSQAGSPSQVGDGAANPVPIRCPYITVRQLDSDLGDFLDVFTQNGTAANYGALLVESLPLNRHVIPSDRYSYHTNKYRPRPAGRTLIHRTAPWPVSSPTVTCKTEGLYVLQKGTMQSRDGNWPEQVETASRDGESTTVDPAQFLEDLKEGGPLGAQCENLPGMNLSTPKFRKDPHRLTHIQRPTAASPSAPSYT
jgi:hypothetical protein